MTRKQFTIACNNHIMPSPKLLKALWLDYIGQWDKAHKLVDSIGTKDAARIHAYLQRKEGDAWNAGYWYQQAGEEIESCPI